MLSVFPTLLSYSLLVPFVFRLVVGILFVVFGYTNITKKRENTIALLTGLKIKSTTSWLWIIALVEMVGGLLLIVGLYTQVLALIFSVMIILKIWLKKKNSEAVSLSKGTLLLLLLITTSLLFLGPGFYAFDLPL